jgi:hypothetical protein
MISRVPLGILTMALPATGVKILDNTLMIATMVHGDPHPEDLRKSFRALQRAQRDIDLRPELYTHYYKKEFPARYHERMDTRRWGPGERLVFDTYTEDAYLRAREWIVGHGIFADGDLGRLSYEESVYAPMDALHRQ